MVGARLVWVDRKFELRDFDQTRAGGVGGLMLVMFMWGRGGGNIAIVNVKVQKYFHPAYLNLHAIRKRSFFNFRFADRNKDDWCYD